MLTNINVTCLGIPEMDVLGLEVGRKLVNLKIQNPRDPGTMHWASGYYYINSLSHLISTTNGYTTTLGLFRANHQVSDVFLRADSKYREASE